MKSSLWAVLADLQVRGLYIREGTALLRPLDWYRWHPSNDARVARYKPLDKPGKPLVAYSKLLEYAAKVGDVYVSGGKVLHIYKPVGKEDTYAPRP